MNLRKGLLSAAVAVAVVTGGVALAGTAHASISPVVEYTQKTSNTAVAGIFAHAPSSSVNFTHITAYVGNDGGSSQEQLRPVTDFPIGNVPGGTVNGVVNGVGLGLCNQGYVHLPFGFGAQIGQVYVGGGLVDIVWAVGPFGHALNNGDPCQNGVVNSTANILMANVPVNDTVELDILYDYAHSYFWRGEGHGAGFITFSGTDLSATPGTTVQDGTSLLRYPGLKFNEADAGAVADAIAVNPLQGSVPLPDVKFSPDLLATIAHLKLNGNVTGGNELFGPAWGNSVGWNSFYVAADKNGGLPSQGNPLYLAPGQVRSDHIRIYVGQPTG